VTLLTYRTVSLFLSALLVIAPPAAAQKAPPWAGAYEEASADLHQGNLARATERFEKLWTDNPNDYVLANAVGAALDAGGFHSQATPWYRRAITLNPRFGPAYNNLALNYAALKQPDKAAQTLRKAVEIDPQNEGAVYNLGLLSLQLRDYRGAAQAFDRAHALKPDDPNPLSRLAYTCFQDKRPSAGLRAVDAMLALGASDAGLAVSAAQLLNSAGLYRAALTRIHAAQTKSGRLPALQYEEAQSLFHLGEYQQAASVLATFRPPENLSLDYHLLLGSAQALGGDLPGAVKTLQAAVQLAPTHPAPYFRLALIFLKGFRDQEARDVIATGLQAAGKSPLLLFGSGVVNEVTGHYESAIDDIRKSLAASPDQTEAWSSLARLYVQVGKYADADQVYKTALNRGAGPDVAVQYAGLLLRFHRFTEAEKLLQDSLSRDSHLPSAYTGLGRLYNEQKKYSEAEKWLRRAIELDPDDASAHLFLATTLERLGRPEEAQQETNLAADKRRSSGDRERASRLRAVLVPQTPSQAENSLGSLTP
jgi:tetratricopeptide (TPR) repeat protein